MTAKTALIIGGIILAVLLLFSVKAFVGNGVSFFGGKGEVGVQEVTLTLGATGYEPDPIRLKAGVPVRITVDTDSVVGCTSSIVMPAFGIRKHAVPGDNVIEFTPDKPGTFPFSCSMGMSRGLIVVE